MTRGQTPSQTVGPYFAYGLTGRQYRYSDTQIAEGIVAGIEGAGERIRIEGCVYDGENQPIGDAMIEIWQADGNGRHAHPDDRRAKNTSFEGFARAGTGIDPQNRFIFETVRPGPVAAGQAPHITVVVMMRGLLSHAYTRIYFPEEGAANAADPVMVSVPADRRKTLIARRIDGAQPPTYRFDIHMQGPEETVFFDV